MRAIVLRSASLAVALAAFALGGCQGNLGSGSGLNIPQTQPYGQPAGPGGGAASQSRQRSLDGAVYLTQEMATLPLPTLGGFSIALQLGSAPPSPSPTPVATATASPRRGKNQRRTKTRALAATTPSSDQNLTASPSPAPAASASAASVPATSASPGSPSPAGSSSPAPASSPAAKIATKLVVYPEDAPPAPTPQPSGNVQTFPVRKALVRGLVKPVADIPLYGLAAVKFTIPVDEDTTSRGFTVGVYTAGKRHHDTLVVSDPKALSSAHVVASSALDSLILKRNTTYLFVLYGDELPATPAPVPAGYPSPGANPFVTPPPGGAPAPVAPPGGYGAPTPLATR